MLMGTTSAAPAGIEWGKDSTKKIVSPKRNEAPIPWKPGNSDRSGMGTSKDPEAFSMNLVSTVQMTISMGMAVTISIPLLAAKGGQADKEFPIRSRSFLLRLLSFIILNIGDVIIRFSKIFA